MCKTADVCLIACRTDGNYLSAGVTFFPRHRERRDAQFALGVTHSIA